MSEWCRMLHSLNAERARRVRDQVLAKAAEPGRAVAVVVVDRTGVILVREFSDQATPESSDASTLKARGACRYQIATDITAEFVKTLPPPPAHHARSLSEACALQGGVPIPVAGEVVGSVLVSGGSAEQDIALAQTGAAGVQ
ncbi:MAG TPA: heme-binding protein [Acidobacteriaceae bacterium]|nr:heme-binding protein [Acidobacteriaceae bacterium]